MSLKRLDYRIFRGRADNAVDLAPVFQDEKCRYALDTKPGRGSRTSIDVELADEGPPGHLRRDLLNDRCDHAARSAPGRPEVEQDRKRRGLDDLGKIRIGDRDGFAGGERERLATATANRHFVRRGGCGHAILGSAGRAFDDLCFRGLCHIYMLFWSASLRQLKFMDIKIGDTFSTRRDVTDELIRQFAELSGDHNPIHLDEEFAKGTRFGRRIAHGMLSGAFISAVLGQEFRRRRIVYLSQTMKFTAPTFIGDIITTTAAVTKIRDDKPVVTLETICRNQYNQVTVKGEAVIMILE